MNYPDNSIPSLLDYMQILFGKFVKAFITGGLSAISGAMAMGISFSDIAGLKHALTVLAIAFISGAVHAAYNAYFPVPTV